MVTKIKSATSMHLLDETGERHGGLFLFFSDFNGLIFVLVCSFFWVWLCVYVCVHMCVCLLMLVKIIAFPHTVYF